MPPDGRRPNTGMLDQQLRDSLKLHEKTLRHTPTGMLSIKIQGVGDVLLSTRMQRTAHRVSLARKRAIACCAGTA